jgi:hypothetical protein
MFGLRMLVVVTFAMAMSLAPAAAQAPAASTPETKRGEDAANKTAEEAAKTTAQETKNGPRSTLGHFESDVLAGGTVNVLTLPFAETVLPVLPDEGIAHIDWDPPAPWQASFCDKERPLKQGLKAVFKKTGTENFQTLVGFQIPAPRCWVPLSQRATLTIDGNIVETNPAMSGKRQLFGGEAYVTVLWQPLLVTLLVLGFIYPGCAAIYWHMRTRNYNREKARLSDSEATALEPPPTFLTSLDPVQITTDPWGRASLGKLQIFLFTLIIFGILLFNLLRRDILTAMSADVLALLGISAAGAAGGKIAYTKSRRLSFENFAWLIRHGWLPKNGTERAIAPPAKWSELFLDSNTKEFDPYGFQMAIFSVVVAIALARTSLAGLGTFHIPSELLGLLGISQAVFVGGKSLDTGGFPELDDKLDELRKHERNIVALNNKTDAKSKEELPKEQDALIESSAQAAQMFAELYHTHFENIPSAVEEAANRMTTAYEDKTRQGEAAPSKPVEGAAPAVADAATLKP